VAIADLRDAGITELVLDLRYNGGGLISVANRLASQIAGPSVAGETLVSYEFNDEYTDVNFDFDAVNASPSLDLDRVLVLTTGQTASSSELVINGERTLGKPFISASRPFCGVSLNAMEAQGVNSNGVTVAGGIEADCFAADDVTRDYGSRSGSLEGMLASSLDFLLNGTCDASPTFAKQPDVREPLFADELPPPGALLDRR